MNKVQTLLDDNVSMGFPGGSVGKNPPANAGDSRDVDLIPGWGRSPGGGNGNPLQYSCLENATDKGAWGYKELDTTERTHTLCINIGSLIMTNVPQ